MSNKENNKFAPYGGVVKHNYFGKIWNSIENTSNGALDVVDAIDRISKDAANSSSNADNAPSSSNPTTTPPSQNMEFYNQMQDVLGDYKKRAPFSYDVNADPLYQQLVDQYSALGDLAMQDTMGQAAAMTGGYGNSYAQNVGQQAYQSYLKQVTDKIPELAAQAYGRYQDEGDEMVDLFNLYGSMHSAEEQRYENELDQYNTDYDRAEKAKAEAKDNVMGLLAMGITPTGDEIEAAGYTSERWGEITKAYQKAREAEAAGVSFGVYTAKEFTDYMFELSDELDAIVSGDDFVASDDEGKSNAIANIRAKALSLLEGAGYSDAANEIYFNLFQKYEYLFENEPDEETGSLLPFGPVADPLSLIGTGVPSKLLPFSSLISPLNEKTATAYEEWLKKNGPKAGPVGGFVGSPYMTVK